MLQDSLGRQFHYLRLSITDVCNFKCSYCLPDGYQCDTERDFLSVPEIKRIVAGFAQLGTSKIRITGGEPALRKDLPDIIRACKQTVGITQVALTTNGFNLEHQIESWVAAGLDSLNVSIDSLQPETFKLITGQDKLTSILRGLEKAHALGVKTIKINAVLMKQFNAHDFNPFLAWIKFKPYTLRFIELMQTGDNLEFFDKNHVKGTDLKQTLLDSNWLPVVKGKQAGPAEEFWHPESVGRIGLIMPYSKDFCVSCNRLRISALGQLHLCLFTEQGIDMRRFLRSDSQQNVFIQQLENALKTKTPSHLLQQGETGITPHLASIGG